MRLTLTILAALFGLCALAVLASALDDLNTARAIFTRSAGITAAEWAFFWRACFAGALGVLALVCGFGAAVLGRLDRIAGLLATRPVDAPRDRMEPRP